MKRRIQILSCLLSAGIALSAVGCAKESAETAGSVQNTQTEENTASADAQTEASADQEDSQSDSTEAASSDQEDSNYANGLFDTTRVHTIDVQISEDDWADLLANPTDKTKYQTTVTIDGNEVKDVSFATKGNTSLSSVADSDSDRYSFKINFGKYVSDQTYGGLDKLNLNNIYADATYMKDYLSYRIFQEAGAYSVSCSYVWITINGEDYGLYLALEDIGEDWLDHYTDGEGNLYKPETAMLNQGNMKKPGEGEDGEMPEMPELTEEQLEAMKNREFPAGGPGGFGGFGSSDSGASLQYTDDEISSYSDIFDNAETDVEEEDQTRLIASLKGLSENSGEDLEEVLDTDEVIRYFVAHNFVMNYDSYTGNMLHNYYLYENDGKLAMIPWDYNLAYGAFMGMGGGGGGPQAPEGQNPADQTAQADVQADASDKIAPDTQLPADQAAQDHTPEGQAQETGSESAGQTAAPDATSGASQKMPGGGDRGSQDATQIVNYGIDSPLSGAEEDDRPMWSWIVDNEEYLEEYHQAFDELMTNYFESGDCQAEIESVYEMILPYVEKDPTAFYTADEFQTAVQTLESFVRLRAESIRAQLDGSLATTTDDQDESARIDASYITIRDMGSQGGGGDHDRNRDTNENQGSDSNQASDGNQDNDSNQASNNNQDSNSN